MQSISIRSTLKVQMYQDPLEVAMLQLSAGRRSRNARRKARSLPTTQTYQAVKADWERMYRYAAPAFECVLPLVLAAVVTEYCLGIPGRYYFSRHVLYGDHGLKSKVQKYKYQSVPLEQRLLVWLRDTQKKKRARHV